MYFIFKCIVCSKGCDLSSIEQKVDRDILCQECLNKYKDHAENPIIATKIKCDICDEDAVFQGGDGTRSNKTLHCKECFLRLWVFNKRKEYNMGSGHIILYCAGGFKGWTWASALVRKFFINGEDLEKTLNDSIVKETNDIMKQDFFNV